MVWTTLSRTNRYLYGLKEKKGKKILPIEFCDDSTSQVTGSLSKQLNTNDEEDGIEWNLK